jgi:hypothetical protein
MALPVGILFLEMPQEGYTQGRAHTPENCDL